MTLALITCRDIPEPDHDETMLLEALRARGVAAEMVAWDAEGGSLAGYDAAVLRSCWNYPDDVEGFQRWLERADQETRLLNPIEVVRWNLDKGYLLGLEAQGVPVVPTRRFEPGSGADWATLVAETGWEDVVIKPAVSAASYHTRRFLPGESEAAAGFFSESAARRATLVQPYLTAFDDPGERAVVWVDGKATHVIRKTVRFAGDAEQVSEALPVTREDREFGELVLGDWAESLLYARVDLVPDEAGRPRLSELELVEPSLFFRQSPAACERFVSALERLLS